jgi:hypothetical protein
MKLYPPLPNGRGPPDPSTTTSNAGFARAAGTRAGNKTATATAIAISVFMPVLRAFDPNLNIAPCRLTLSQRLYHQHAYLEQTREQRCQRIQTNKRALLLPLSSHLDKHDGAFDKESYHGNGSWWK